MKRVLSRRLEELELRENDYVCTRRMSNVKPYSSIDVGQLAL